MALLSWADLSYVLPVTSMAYVLVALVGRFVLHEAVSMAHWSGILLIMIGVALVGSTNPNSAGKPSEGAHP
jgi:drug/metabolite transporter (DMT)-like permease